MAVTAILMYICLALVSVVAYFLRKNLSYWKNLDIPHEEPHFLMGSMRNFRTSMSMGEIFARYYRKFKGSGPFAGAYMGQRPAVVLLEKETIKQILIKDFNNFTDRGFYYNEKSDPLTGHLFRLDGEKWRRLRTKLSPTFTSGKMKVMYPTLLKVVDDFMKVFAEQLQTSSFVEVRDLLGRFTTDVIGSVAFGIECNSLSNPDAEFLKFGRKSLEVPRHNNAVMGFIDSFPKLAQKLGMRVLPEDVHQFFMKTITDTIKYRLEHNIQRNDFINLLVNLKETEEKNSILGSLTIEEMAAQVFVFFLGGFETSSSTMSYALYEMAQNQDVQNRLREEVTQVFENYKDSEVPYDVIMNLQYLDQVLSETLRKYPIVPTLNRVALSDYAIPGHHKYKIEKGTAVIIPVLGIQHDPEFYPNPVEFDPNRFSPDMVKQRDAMEWLPFGDGPRNCIGMRFGKMQSRVGLANLIYRFRFSVCPKTEIPLTFNPVPVVLVPLNLVYLNAEAV